MKKIIYPLAILSLVVMFGCDVESEENQVKTVEMEEVDVQVVEEDTTGPQIKFETLAYDFGEVVEGELVNYEFQFTNTGNEPLLIQQVKGSCGCTVPVKPEGAIAPGESNVIAVEFNSAHRVGSTNKHVNVETNVSKEIITLHLTGKVLEK